MATNFALPSLTGLGAVADGDLLYIVDISDTTDGAQGTSKKVTVSALLTAKANAGANSDITSLSGLTTPLTVAQGGIGVGTLAAGLVRGNGTSALSVITTSAALAALLSDETGSGALVFGTSPTIATPVVSGGAFTSPVLTTPQINDTSSDHQYVFAVSELAADRTVTLPLLTGADTFVFQDHTQTLTNKRVTKRVGTVASSATPTINTDNVDMFTITALAEAITSMTTNLSGTPTNGQTLVIRFLDNGTARAITWGASFASRGATLPTTTVLSKYLYVGLIYNSTAAVWDCIAVSQEI